MTVDPKILANHLPTAKPGFVAQGSTYQSFQKSLHRFVATNQTHKHFDKTKQELLTKQVQRFKKYIQRGGISEFQKKDAVNKLSEQGGAKFTLSDKRFAKSILDYYKKDREQPNLEAEQKSKAFAEAKKEQRLRQMRTRVYGQNQDNEKEKGITGFAQKYSHSLGGITKNAVSGSAIAEHSVSISDAMKKDAFNSTKHNLSSGSVSWGQKGKPPIIGLAKIS